MYCAKLKSLLSLYVESRMVNSFDGLMSLIVCDRIKSTLSENCLRHVLSVEAGTTKGSLEAQALAECVDQFRDNHFENDKHRASAIGDTRKANWYCIVVVHFFDPWNLSKWSMGGAGGGPKSEEAELNNHWRLLTHCYLYLRS